MFPSTGADYVISQTDSRGVSQSGKAQTLWSKTDQAQKGGVYAATRITHIAKTPFL